MNVYESIRLEDCPPYREVEFKIPQGISTIYGLNKVHQNSKNSNGAGKSYLFGQIFETQYGESLGGKAEDKIKKGIRTVNITNYRGQKIRITKGGSKTEVFADGTPKARTTSIAKKEIQALVPISAEDYEAYCFVNCRAGHPLVMGGNTERKKFFTRFFQIDKIDEEKKMVGKKLRDLKSVRAAYTEAKKTFDELKAALKEKKDKEVLKADLESLQTKLESLQKKQELRQDYERYTLFLESAKSHIKKVSKHCQLNEESLEEFHSELKVKLKDLKAKLESAREYLEYKKALAKYNEAVEKIPAKVYAKFKDEKLSKLESAYDKAHSLLAVIERNSEKLKQLDLEQPKKVTNPKVNLGELETERAKLEHQLKHAKKFGSGICDTCGQEVKTANPKKVQQRIDECAEQIKAQRKYMQYCEAMNAYEEACQLASELKASTKEAKRKLEIVEDAADAYSYFRKLPDRPAKFNGEATKIADVQEQIDKVQSLLDSVKFLQPSVDLLAKAPKESPDYSKEIRDLSDRLSSIRADLEVVQTYRKKLKPLKVRLAEYKEQLREEADLKIIYEGYNDKAMKKMVVEQISQLLMAQVNKYASMVFPEKYSFEIVWDSKLHILCHRKYGKRIETSDVRKLSGAESTLFTLIMVMSLLTFVPSPKRSSVLILDEPSGSMHEETRQSVISFLKIMNTVIPSIVIITPKTEELYPNAKAYTVIKEAGRSRLVEGHPSEIGVTK